MTATTASLLEVNRARKFPATGPEGQCCPVRRTGTGPGVPDGNLVVRRDLLCS
jgi:hypothetical protein